MVSDTVVLIGIAAAAVTGCGLIAWREGRKSKGRLIDPNNPDKKALKPDIATCDSEAWRREIKSKEDK